MSQQTAFDMEVNFTELVRLTDRMDLKERFFEMFIHQSPYCIWFKDYTCNEGRMVFISETYGEIFDRTEQDYIGKTDYDLWPKEVADYFRDQDMLVMKGGKAVYTHESLGLSSHPDWQNCRTVKFPVRDNNGKIVGVGGMAWPVDEAP